MIEIPIVKVSDNKFKVAVDATIYAKEAIVAACYKFTDTFYVFQNIDTVNDKNVEVIAETKDGHSIQEDVVKRFCNELIDQQVRYDMNQQFGHIRDLIVEEAFKPVNK